MSDRRHLNRHQQRAARALAASQGINYMQALETVRKRGSSAIARSSKRACVFCGGRPVTQEHLIPQWAKRFTDGDHKRILHLVERQGGVSERPRSWIAKGFGRRAGIACASCNNGWLSDLEHGVSALLDPGAMDGRTLTAKEQTLLSFWAVKTALALDAAHPAKNRIVATDVAHRLWQDRTPPDHIRVWMTSYTGNDDQLLALDAVGVDLDDRQDDQRGWRDVAVVTYGLGPFVFQVFVAAAPEAMAITLAPIGNVHQLWPLEGDVTWRRTPGLTEGALLAFAEQIPRSIGASQVRLRW